MSQKSENDIPFSAVDFLQLPEDILNEENEWHNFFCSQISHFDRLKQEFSLTFLETSKVLSNTIFIKSSTKLTHESITTTY